MYFVVIHVIYRIRRIVPIDFAGSCYRILCPHQIQQVVVDNVRHRQIPRLAEASILVQVIYCTLNRDCSRSILITVIKIHGVAHGPVALHGQLAREYDPVGRTSGDRPRATRVRGHRERGGRLGAVEKFGQCGCQARDCVGTAAVLRDRVHLVINRDVSRAGGPGVWGDGVKHVIRTAPAGCDIRDPGW